ncbi:polymorphic toxin type 44 domain-containing protein [Streptomyces sp. NPDC048057]|uniref:polymorphic toxin type 44 domain-containing protein n=1 Tax=Streptomyces sp. NPDC048057 TaxID=3155628 RepID=UPI0033F9F06D
MTTNLAPLTTAAESWETTASKFAEVEREYRRDVHAVARDPTWLGLSALAANARFEVTLQELVGAQQQAKAVAGVLREAHARFTRLRSQVQSVHDAAVENGMRVSAEGRVSYDTSRLTPSQLTAYQRHPDHREAVIAVAAEWEGQLERAVRAVGRADADVAVALVAVGVDSDPDDGTANGFNREASADIARYRRHADSEGRYTDAQKYIYDEMMRNVDSDTVRMIQGLLREPEWYEFGRNYGSDVTAALTLWGAKVAPGQDWDHKPLIRDRYDVERVDQLFFKQPGSNREVFYDIYSNIHYGYVGRAAGFDQDTLIQGASLGEDLLTGKDDHGDQITMKVGMELYDRHGKDLTREQLDAAIRDAMDKMERAQQEGKDVPQIRNVR